MTLARRRKVLAAVGCSHAAVAAGEMIVHAFLLVAAGGLEDGRSSPDGGACHPSRPPASGYSGCCRRSQTITRSYPPAKS
jgi:hypothetical protein